jgi:hypothetical protein
VREAWVARGRHHHCWWISLGTGGSSLPWVAPRVVEALPRRWLSALFSSPSSLGVLVLAGGGPLMVLPRRWSLPVIMGAYRRRRWLLAVGLVLAGGGPSSSVVARAAVGVDAPWVLLSLPRSPPPSRPVLSLLLSMLPYFPEGVLRLHWCSPHFSWCSSRRRLPLLVMEKQYKISRKKKTRKKERKKHT